MDKAVVTLLICSFRGGQETIAHCLYALSYLNRSKVWYACIITPATIATCRWGALLLRVSVGALLPPPKDWMEPAALEAGDILRLGYIIAYTGGGCFERTEISFIPFQWRIQQIDTITYPFEEQPDSPRQIHRWSPWCSLPVFSVSKKVQRSVHLQAKRPSKNLWILLYPLEKSK